MRVQTPRFCDASFSAVTFLRDFWTVRGLAISWLIVGMSAFTLLFARQPNIGSANSCWDLTAPLFSFPFRAIHSRKTKSRQPLIAERKALRRHRGPRIDQAATCCSAEQRDNESEFNFKSTAREKRSNWHFLAIIDSV